MLHNYNTIYLKKNTSFDCMHIWKTTIIIEIRKIIYKKLVTQIRDEEVQTQEV